MMEALSFPLNEGGNGGSEKGRGNTKLRPEEGRLNLELGFVFSLGQAGIGNSSNSLATRFNMAGFRYIHRAPSHLGIPWTSVACSSPWLTGWDGV